MLLTVLQYFNASSEWVAITAGMLWQFIIVDGTASNNGSKLCTGWKIHDYMTWGIHIIITKFTCFQFTLLGMYPLKPLAIWLFCGTIILVGILQVGTKKACTIISKLPKQSIIIYCPYEIKVTIICPSTGTSILIALQKWL